MYQANDCLYNAFLEIRQDGALMLDEEYIINIFSSLHNVLPELKTFLDYYFEQKEVNVVVVGSKDSESRVLGIDIARAELFYPKQAANRKTNCRCEELAVRLATCSILMVTDKRRSTYDHFSANPDAQWAGNNLTEEVRQAGLSVCANNNASEGMLAVFTDAFSRNGRVSHEGAAGEGQSRFNNDMGRQSEKLVTGKSSKNTNKKTTGLFHQLPWELQDSLMVCGKKHADQTRKGFAEVLRQESVAKEEKAQFAREKRLKSAEDDLILASYLHQQYDSPRCCKTAKEAFDVYNELTSKSAKFKFVKGQIQIQSVGLGWPEAHHPWSKNNVHFTPTQLMEHFVNVVIPLAEYCARKTTNQTPTRYTRYQTYPKWESLHNITSTLINPFVMKKQIFESEQCVSGIDYKIMDMGMS